MITEHSKVEKSQAFSLLQVWISIYLNLSFLEVKQTLHHQQTCELDMAYVWYELDSMSFS